MNIDFHIECKNCHSNSSSKHKNILKNLMIMEMIVLQSIGYI